MQKKLIAFTAAAAFALGAVAPAHATQTQTYVPVHHHASPWVVSSVVITAAILIGCAAIVNARYNRELTQQEAWFSSLFPLGCLYRPPR